MMVSLGHSVARITKERMVEAAGLLAMELVELEMVVVLVVAAPGVLVASEEQSVVVLEEAPMGVVATGALTTEMEVQAQAIINSIKPLPLP